MDFITYNQASALFYFILSILIGGFISIIIIGISLRLSGVKLFSDKYEKLNEFERICFHISIISIIAFIVVLILGILYIINGGI